MDECLFDANQCVSLDKNWPKGYFRLGTAFLQINQQANALMAFELGASFLQSATSSGTSREKDNDKLAKEFSEAIKVLEKDASDAKSSGRVAELARVTVTAEAIALCLDRDREGEEGDGPMTSIYIRTLSEGGDLFPVALCLTESIRRVLLYCACIRD